MVPGRRRLPDRPEPADHHAVPHPRGRRRREPRLRLGRSPADDDRPHEAARALRLAADDPRPDARGRRAAVRRRHPSAWRRRRAAPASWTRIGEIRSADRGRAADHPRARRLHPGAPGRRRSAGPPPARSRRPPIETDPAIVTELIERSEASRRRRSQRDIQDEVRIGAARLHPGGHPGAEAAPVRAAEPCRRSWRGWRPTWWLNDQLRGVAGREERGRHADAVGPPQRHVGDGAGAARRRGRDPPASGGRGVPREQRRGRRLPGRAAEARRRAGGARRHPAPTSTSTACAASARSTSRGRAGASAPPRSCR